METKVKLLITYATLASLSMGMIFPYIPLYGQEIGMPISLIGYLVFVYYLTEMFTRIPVGQITNQIGYPKITITAGILSIISATLYLTSNLIWPLLFLAQITFAIAFAIAWVSIPAYITKAKGSLPKYTFLVGIGWLFGPPIGGITRDYYGMTHLFIILTIISITLLTISIYFYKHTQTQNHSKNLQKNTNKNRKPTLKNTIKSTKNSYKKAHHLLLNRKKVLIATLVSLIMFMSFGLLASVIPLHLEDIGFTSFMIGIFAATQTTISSAIRLKTNPIVKILGRVNILIIGTAICGIAISTVSIITHPTTLILISAIWGLGHGLYLPIAFDLIADDTNIEERDIGMGLRGTVGTAGSAISVLTFMYLAEITTFSLSIATFGIIMTTFAITLHIYWKQKGTCR
ncbi:MFS family permease [Methanonatronarchaeum thermophilum]|uniref:MFS family permease n=2 Tax=Methanonatronarchaeum thermophilum TaxID=1927129 RepID=A0A1Y3GA87_9EURY|nr:MFS transporter [Methanonatronarchaeum thermophilum]OUJ18338.1 MFS family permease [Methanonatronarchaeum thermophilum]